MPDYTLLTPGEPGPWFKARTASIPRYTFDTAAGRWMLLGFIGSAGSEAGARMRAAAMSLQPMLDGDRIAFFGVTVDPEDEAQGRVQDAVPGTRWFFDLDGAVSRVYGAVPKDWTPDAGLQSARPVWFLLDPTMRIAGVFPAGGDEAVLAQLREVVRALPPPELFAGMPLQAPILYLPGVFEPELCRELIAAYAGEPQPEMSGFMLQQPDGKTILAHDPAHKKRRDHMLNDQRLIGSARVRVLKRLVPEIKKIHQFTVTRMERHLVACYADDDGGHFRSHRDNTTSGTAHRRFAVSINLNADFEGGEIGFPEYGPRTFKPPPGGAVVFSCSMLHRVTPVTKGRRYAYLPFLYDDAAAQVREANAAALPADYVPYVLAAKTPKAASLPGPPRAERRRQGRQRPR